jgi:hypothetical protein
MTRCLKCGSTLAPHARFCSVCGAESAPAAPQNASSPNATQGFTPASAHTGMQPAYAATPDADAENKKRMMMIGGGTAALLILAAIFISASGILGAKKPKTDNAGVLIAPPAKPAAAPLIVAPAPKASDAPVVTAPPAQGNPMPADVIDYLRWLKQFEAGRVALESKSESQMMLVVQELVKVGMVGTKAMGLLEGDSEEASRNSANAGPTIDTRAVNAVIADWNKAAGIFQGRTPPNACATIAGNYNTGLTTSVSSMSQILGGAVKAVESINQANGEKTADASNMLSFLTDQKNNAGISKTIESSFTASNQALDALRSQYTEIPADIDKGQFTIKSGNAGGMNIPIPGMGM